jgi:hypothetical protein
MNFLSSRSSLQTAEDAGGTSFSPEISEVRSFMKKRLARWAFFALLAILVFACCFV